MLIKSGSPIMDHIWETIKNYYTSLGKNYHVNPVIFLVLHIIATPLFVLCVGWLVHAYKKKEETMLPVIVSVLVFNAANIYLVAAGKNIPWWIYAVLIITTIISGVFSILKIRKKIKGKEK